LTPMYRPIDYRCDDCCFQVYAQGCQLSTPTSQKLRVE
jgi:hypothetical protein